MFTALWRLLLPILAEHQHDPVARLARVDRLLRLSAFVTLPVCGGLLVALGPLTALVLGPAWRDVGAAAEPLVALTDTPGADLPRRCGAGGGGRGAVHAVRQPREPRGDGGFRADDAAGDAVAGGACSGVPRNCSSPLTACG